MSEKAIESLSPHAADLRRESADCYLGTLFAPVAKRDALFALYAFDHEIARVQRLVREPMAGLIRLQWWDDVIDGLERGETVAHPVVQALQHAVSTGGLDRARLKRAIDARRRPFEEEMPSEQTFERYLADTGGSVAEAAAVLLGVEKDETLTAARQTGAARAAAEQLRLLGSGASDRPAWLPSVWCNGQGDNATSGAVRHLADWGLSALAEARRRGASITRSELAAFFPGTLAGLRLRDPERLGRLPTLPNATPTLIWCWLRGRF